MRSLFLCGLLALATVYLPACGDTDKAGTSNNPNNKSSGNDTSGGSCSASNATATKQVNLQNFAFSPTCIKVAKGDTVTFTNKDSADHTVTGQTTDTFNSPIAAGASITHTFNTAGTVDVVCTIHPSMLMTVVVQ